MSYKETRDKAALGFSKKRLFRREEPNETLAYREGYDAGFTAPEVLALVEVINEQISQAETDERCGERGNTNWEELFHFERKERIRDLTEILQAYQAAKEESQK
jgi:hypothetical protein